MAKPVENLKKPQGRVPSAKLVAVVTLVLALILTAVSGWLGLFGRKLDKEGLYHLLAWIPTPRQSSTWRQALQPGPDFGDNIQQIYAVAAPAEGAEVSQTDLDKTMQLIGRRLAAAGLLNATAEKLDDGNIQLILPNDPDAHAAALLTQKGELGFASEDGQVFLTQDHITRATYQLNPQDGTYALSFFLDGEGKQIFADKTTELLGQKMSLMVDGVAVASPNIGYQPLTEGQASLPGFDKEHAAAYAAIMMSEPLPLQLTHQDDQAGEALFGSGAQHLSIYLMYAAALLIMLAFVLRFRLGGLIAAWLLGIHLIAAFFFAALIRSGYTLSTLLAIYASFGLLCYALVLLYNGMTDDLKRGRAVRQALKDSHAGPGRLALEVLGALLLLCVALIILDSGLIGNFARLFAIYLLIDLVLLALVQRVLMGAAITLFGTKTALYFGARKEAVQ